MKIALVGAHCTGKTTLAQALETKMGFPFLKLDEAAKLGAELAPNLRLDKIPTDKQRDLQRAFYKNAQKLQDSEGPFILDCCSLTCIPYRKLLNTPFQLGTDALESINSARQLDFIFYLPPEIPYKAENFRPKAPETRSYIDKEILHLLDSEEIPYTTLHGTVKQRVEQIFSTINYKQSQEIVKKKGAYIAFEGLPGSGKTTQIEMLKNRLEGLGYKTHVCERTFTEEKKNRIFELYKDTKNNAKELLELHVQAFREQEWKNQVPQRLRDGEIVITDRHIATVTTFHEALGIIPREEILQSIGDILRPSKTIYIDIPPALAISRIIERGEEKETPAKKDFLVQSEVRRNYQHWLKSAVGAISVCGSQNQKRIHENIMDALKFEPDFSAVVEASKHIERMYSRQKTTPIWGESEILLDLQYQVGQMARNYLQTHRLCHEKIEEPQKELALDISDVIYLSSLLAGKRGIDLNEAFSAHTKVEAEKINKRVNEVNKDK